MTAEVNVTTKSIQNNILLNINKMIKSKSIYWKKSVVWLCLLLLQLFKIL